MAMTLQERIADYHRPTNLLSATDAQTLELIRQHVVEPEISSMAATILRGEYEKAERFWDSLVAADYSLVTSDTHRVFRRGSKLLFTQQL